jgi:hypothetical protein
MPASDHDPVLRRRIEMGIRLAAPLLDLALAVGDRASRLLGSEDPDHVPSDVRRDGAGAARGLSVRGTSSMRRP